MSIINTQKFKNRKRLITEPIYSQQRSLHHHEKEQSSKSLINHNLEAHAKKEPNNINSVSYKEGEYKSIKSQIIHLSDSNNLAHENNIKKEDNRQKPYRYLQIDAVKQVNPPKLMMKSLSKDKNSSTQSLRIHKIKSIVNLQAKKQANPGKKTSMRHPKAYTYDNNEQIANNNEGKETLIREEISLKKKRRLKTEGGQAKQELIAKIERQFQILRLQIKEIDQNTKQPKEHPQADSILKKCQRLNKKTKDAAARIIFRWLVKSYRQCLSYFQQKLMTV